METTETEDMHITNVNCIADMGTEELFLFAIKERWISTANALNQYVPNLTNASAIVAVAESLKALRSLHQEKKLDLGAETLSPSIQTIMLVMAAIADSLESHGQEQISQRDGICAAVLMLTFFIGKRPPNKETFSLDVIAREMGDEHMKFIESEIDIINATMIKEVMH